MTALSFHSSHGSNIKLPDLQTACHSYARAQGIFMLATPLLVTSHFQLRFEGKGIVKLQALPTKDDAVAWLRSQKPLPKGCIRLRNCKSSVWKVRFDPSRDSVLFFNKDLGLQEARGGGMLLFDIEYGDVCVTAVTASLPEVLFDSFTHSKHIQIVRRAGCSSAQLKLFNPLGLCRLHSPVEKGQTLRLRVQGNKGHSGMGPYFRLRMTPCGANGHQKQFLLGPDTKYESDLYGVEASQRKELALTCCHGEQAGFVGLDTDDRTTEVKLTWPWSGGCFLWFELNKVSLRAWLLRDPNRPYLAGCSVHTTTRGTVRQRYGETRNATEINVRGALFEVCRDRGAGHT
ncbi:hypothetical protein ElyMa_003314800 [Elysia marginata]|uniref:Uncharacterized protein n=1 Tax=Elysia marginata TaxID=1093978 RepID=A0AAV4JFE0_9GAST|nr:hypothetical protein ElyMa_003314800 [Elysia marginata]